MVKSLPEWHFSCTMFIYNSDIFLSLLLAVYVESQLFIATWYLDTRREKKKTLVLNRFQPQYTTWKKQRCWKLYNCPHRQKDYSTKAIRGSGNVLLWIQIFCHLFNSWLRSEMAVILQEI